MRTKEGLKQNYKQLTILMSIVLMVLILGVMRMGISDIGRLRGIEDNGIRWYYKD